MEYEVGSVADLISGLVTPNRPRARSRVPNRAPTPTKQPQPPPHTPGDSPSKPTRKASRLVLSDPEPEPEPVPQPQLQHDYLNSPKSVPLKHRKAKVANNFQFLSQIDDCEGELADTANRRAKLVKKGKDPEMIVREYYEDKTGIIELKNVKNATDDNSADKENEVNPSDSKKVKKNKKKNDSEDPSISPYQEAMKDEILAKVNKLKNKQIKENTKNNDDNSNVAKSKKVKSKKVSNDDEGEVKKLNKKKRKHEDIEPTEDSTLDKVIKKRMKKSKKIKQIEEDDEPAEESASVNGDDQNELQNEDEDEDEGLTDFQKAAKRRIASKAKKEKKFEVDEIDRTLFVGNIPVSILKGKYRKILKRKFSVHGAIESMRVRNIPVVDFKTKPMVALIENKFHPERSSVTAYIKYVEASSVEKALVENNTLIDGNHIRVDNCRSTKPQTDNRRTLFLGNLPFNVEEETIRDLFEKCGSIESIRIIRDRKTQIGKGFGFVNFMKAEGVELALACPEEDLNIKGKVIRIKRYNTNPNTNTLQPPSKTSRADNNSNERGLKQKNFDNGRNEQMNKKSLGKKRDEHGNKIRKRNLVGDNIRNKYKQKAQHNPDSNDNNENVDADGPKGNVTNKESKENKEKGDGKSFIGVMAKKKKKHKLNKGILKKKKISKILMHNANTVK